MTAAVIILLVFAFLLLLLLLPVSVFLDKDVHLRLRVKYFGITLFDSAKSSEKPKQEEPLQEGKEKTENPVLKFFGRLKAEKGFLGAVRFCFSLLKIVADKCLFIIKRIKIQNLRLWVCVASSDAAQTAIEYGAVCAAVYPPLALLQQCGSLKAEKINVSADFDSDTSSFSVSFIAKSNLLILIFCLCKGFIEYKRLEREWK